MWYAKPSAVWQSCRNWLDRNKTLFLGVVSFAESLVPSPPAELVLLPMAALQPHKARFYGIVTSVTSIIGAVAGYGAGYGALSLIRNHWPSLGGAIDQWLALFQSDILTTAALLALSALVHVPPSKVACVVSGAAGVPLWLFIPVTGVVRSAKFMAIAYAAPRFAPQMADLWHRYKKPLLLLGGSAVVVAVWYMWHRQAV